MKPETNIEEFNRLEFLLNLDHVPYEREDTTNSYIDQHIIYFPNKKTWISYATICDPYSEGVELGLLEQTGLLPKRMVDKENSNSEGYLDALTIAKRWRSKYFSDLIKMGIIDKNWLLDFIE